MKVVWAEEASADVKSAFEHIVRDDPYAAERVRTALHAAGAELGNFPLMGHLVEGSDLREFVHPRYRYVFQSSVEEDGGEVLIHRVWHGSQDRGTSR